MVEEQMPLVIGIIPALLVAPGTCLGFLFTVPEELGVLELGVELEVPGLVHEAALSAGEGFLGSRPGLTELERKCKIWAR